MGIIHQRHYCPGCWYKELEIPVLIPSFSNIKDSPNKEKEKYINYVVNITCNLPSLHRKVSLTKVYQNMKKTLNTSYVESGRYIYMVISKTT